MIEYLVLFLTAVFAGFVDAIAGGGGLITLPALLLTGMSPLAAMATNKFQGSFASIAAAYSFIKKRLIDWSIGYKIIFIAYIGGFIGALFISSMPKDVLKYALPPILLLVAIYFIFSKNLNIENRKAKITKLSFIITAIPIIGFYDGAIGPGTGSFYMIAYTYLLGFGVISAVAHTKIANAACNLGALTVFSLQGNIVILLGIIMALGATLGAFLGSFYIIKYNTKIIRPMLIIISISMAAKLIFNAINSN